MSKAARAAVLFLAAVCLPAYAESCVWYADGDAIFQVETSNNQVIRSIILKHPHRLLMDAADCGVWSADKLDRRLLRFNADGLPVREIEVRKLDPNLTAIEQVEVDPYDGSLWVADDRRLARISAEGQLLAGITVPDQIRRIQVALDQNLWALGKQELWRFDPQGRLVASYSLATQIAADARHLVIDSLGGFIWLADEHGLAQLKLSNPSEPALRIRLKNPIAALALDPHTGNLWVTQMEWLLAYSRSGELAYAVDLQAFQIRKPERLAFDPMSRSLWVGAERTVSRFSDSGELVVRFDAGDADQAVGAPAFIVQTTLTLIRPPQDALTNNPRPEFRLGYGAECNGGACGFAGSYFGSYQLSATLNAQSIGRAFQFDANAGEAFYVPPERLPEGANNFSAQVKDGFGHSSNSISNPFTIDTIAPKFLTLSPADGSVLQTPQAVLQGTVDDPLATVVLEATGLTQGGPNFSFPVTLQPGVNIFTLSAIDRAGNRATTQRTISYVPLTITITAPTAGATVSGSSILVSGTIQGPLNTGVTANGFMAALMGNQFFAQVPLAVGANTITVIAATPDGFRVERSVSVVSSGPPTVEIVADRTSGVAPLKVVFRANASVPVQRIDADFDGNGTTDAVVSKANTAIEFTYAQPGIYPARFVITDNQGTSTTQVVQVIVQDRIVLDSMLKAVWQGFVGTMIAGNVSGAAGYLSDSAKEVYVPMLEALRNRLPAIAATFSELRTFSLSSGLGEYAIRRTESNGKTYMYLIYFRLEPDGVWRLESM